jgi:hypothetical protein
LRWIFQRGISRHIDATRNCGFVGQGRCDPASTFREVLPNGNLIRKYTMKHYTAPKTYQEAPDDPTINGYIHMLRTKYLEFKRTTEPSITEDYPEPRYYLVTTKYNLPKKMVENHDYKLASLGSNVDVDQHLKLELDYRQTIPYVYKQSQLLHNHICNKTVKNHFRPKNTKFLPLGLSFVDFPRAGKRYFKLHELPHTHAIYLIHPSKIEEFENLVAQDFRLQGLQLKLGEEFRGRYQNTFNIQEVDVREMGNTRNDLYRTISYSSKYHSSNFNQRLEYDLRSISFDVFNRLR